MLSKLKIIAYDAPPKLQDFGKDSLGNALRLARSELTEFVAYYNPESLQVQVGSKQKSTPTTAGVPSNGPLTLERTTYTFKLVIDGTGVSGPKVTSVKAMVDKFLALGQRVPAENDSTTLPFLDVVWGDFYLQCQLQSANVSYTLFSPEGRPLRAMIDCTFVEYVPQEAQNAANASLPVQLLTQASGETLAQFAARTGVPINTAVEMARKNDLDNLRTLRSTTALIP